MGIQFNQIDNLQSYFDAVSGNLQAQIDADSISDIASGTFGFQGIKYFEGNVDFSGAQGIFVDPNNIYTPNTVFAGALKIGGGISVPRNTTAAPAGALQVTGGASYFEGDVNIRNNGDLNALDINASSLIGGTGEFYQATGSFVDYASGSFAEVTSEGLLVSGAVTGIVRLLELPYDSAGLTSGELYRSGNHLMII